MVEAANLKKLSDFDNKSLLIVDDDNPFRDRLARAMEKKGFEVFQAEGVQKGILSVKEKKPAFAVVDLRLADGNGLEVVKQIQTSNPNSRIIMLTGYGNIPTAVAAIKEGAIDYLAKPADADEQGLKIAEETVSIKIPAGVVDGMQLKVAGKGNEAPGNGISGDLLVAIEEEAHESLQREGDNLHYDLYVSLPDAILGTSKEIDTVTGKVRIKIEQGVQSGKILRLRGKGIPSINGYGRGDLLVHVNVWTPKTLSKQQREFFENMREDEHFTPKPESTDKSFFEKVKDMFS